MSGASRARALALGSGARVETSVPAIVRAPASIALALFRFAGSVTAIRIESGAACQPFMLAEPPRVVGIGVSVAAVLGSAVFGRVFVSSALLPRFSRGNALCSSSRASVSLVARVFGSAVPAGEPRIGVDVEGRFGVVAGGVFKLRNGGAALLPPP